MISVHFVCRISLPLNRLLTRSARSSSSIALGMERSAESLSKRLWEDSRGEALCALYNPFVVSLGAGTLRLRNFQQYIAQDEFFLTAFAQAYGLAMDHSNDPEIRSEISELQQAAYDELKLHSSLMKEWNIDASQKPATTSYTDFLLGVAAGKSFAADKASLVAFTLGAMTPCMRLYAFIGREINSARANRDDHPYEEWISTYSSAEFEEAAARLERLVDKLFVPEDFAVMKKLYHLAMRHEVDFFDAQCCGSSNVPLVTNVALKDRKLILVSDFDSTCTVSDSCPVLAELAMANGASDVRERWNRLSEGYFKDYDQLLQTLLQDQNEDAYDYDQVRAALKIVSDFEKEGNSKVISSGVLQSINLDDVRRAAEDMPLQIGCDRLFRRLVERGSISCNVLSVCWSQTFIEAALSKAKIKQVSIYSNEFCSNGSLIRRIETPWDKERFMLEELMSPGREEQFVIYVGDSLTDLLCLLQADIGIVVGNSSTLNKAATAFGLKIVPLLSSVLDWESSGGDSAEAWRKTQGTLYRVSGWLEIEAFLLGHDKEEGESTTGAAAG